MADGDVLNIQEILRKLPHRFPFLMVDRIREVEPNRRIVGIKNVTVNEPYFQGHFPVRPIMPGVLVIESLAQAAGVLVIHTLGEAGEGRLIYFMSIDNARFRKPVEPGDVLVLEVEKERERGNVWRLGCVAKVDDGVVAQATITAMLLSPEESAQV